jgi:hypothetical protein
MYTLLCQVLGFAVPHYQPQAECAKLLAGAKTILLSQTGMFYCCSSSVVAQNNNLVAL